MKDRTSAGCIGGIKDSAERFYDRPGDGEAHTQTIFLRRKKMLEDPLAYLFREPGPEVAHGRTDSSVRLRSWPQSSSGEHYPAVIQRRPLHRLESIQNQIEQYLLKLNCVR